MNATEERSSDEHVAQHGAIFRASFFTGGAQIVTSLASLTRSKCAALILGVARIGTNGLFFQAVRLVQTALGFGIASSFIRAVASAYALGGRRLSSRTTRFLTTSFDSHADSSEDRHEYGIDLLLSTVQRSYDTIVLAVKHKKTASDFILERLLNFGGAKPTVIIDTKNLSTCAAIVVSRVPFWQVRIISARLA